MNLTKKDFWQSNASYVSSTRYKSFVLYDGLLYLCTESHTSTDEFDIEKFSPISSSGTDFSGEISSLVDRVTITENLISDIPKKANFDTITSTISTTVNNPVVSIPDTVNSIIYDVTAHNGSNTTQSLRLPSSYDSDFYFKCISSNENVQAVYVTIENRTDQSALTVFDQGSAWFRYFKGDISVCKPSNISNKLSNLSFGNLSSSFTYPSNGYLNNASGLPADGRMGSHTESVTLNLNAGVWSIYNILDLNYVLSVNDYIYVTLIANGTCSGVISLNYGYAGQPYNSKCSVAVPTSLNETFIYKVFLISKTIFAQRIN